MEEVVFVRDEKGEVTPTIENFYKFCGIGKLMAVKCNKCGRLFVPPRVVCPDCYSSSFRWIELSGKGKLQSYSVVHIGPKKFASKTPYTIGIVKMEEGVSLPSLILSDKNGDIEIGIDLVVDFEAPQSDDWPKWPRYLFRPAKKT